MDALKNLAGGNKAGNTQQPAGSGVNAPVAGGQKDDYGDKGAEFVNKKYLGDKLNRTQLEKITDKGRETLEKATGKKVPDKVSN
ncbi:hypothetical protein GGR50DRAFT_98178 [Xylaria sp. CBS 124048]|nr:hypothetical protein GGR50DRAFT_98178 [Xylaria sp. CBS 124048]